MTISHPPPEITKNLDADDLWGRAAAGDVTATRAILAARQRALMRWRGRAIRAESALRAAMRGGRN